MGSTWVGVYGRLMHERGETPDRIGATFAFARAGRLWGARDISTRDTGKAWPNVFIQLTVMGQSGPETSGKHAANPRPKRCILGLSRALARKIRVSCAAP